MDRSHKFAGQTGRELSDEDMLDLPLSDHLTPEKNTEKKVLTGLFWEKIEALFDHLQEEAPGQIRQSLYPTASFLQPDSDEILFYSHKSEENLVITRIFLHYNNDYPYPIALYSGGIDGDDDVHSKECSRSVELLNENIKALKIGAEKVVNRIPQLLKGTPDNPHDGAWMHMRAEKDVGLSHATYGHRGKGAPPIPPFKVTAVFQVDVRRSYWQMKKRIKTESE
ncbi:hypothetical protein PMIN06_002325 [Paraphaeosphaeria minitans]